MSKLEQNENKQIGADRRIFPRVVLLAGIALLIMLVAAIFIARPAAKKIQPITPKGRSAVQAIQIQQFA